jgi:CheY-like chemotaxis protein
MVDELVILIVEDDDGHARLTEKNLRRAGIKNTMARFRDGQEIMDFLFCRGEGRKRQNETAYLLLLDIRIPKIDGVEVLRQIKRHDELRKIPVIMLTTMDDPREVESCHDLGCSHYIVKPVEYDKFSEVLSQLGLFLKIVQVPHIHCETSSE